MAHKFTACEWSLFFTEVPPRQADSSSEGNAAAWVSCPFPVEGH